MKLKCFKGFGLVAAIGAMALGVGMVQSNAVEGANAILETAYTLDLSKLAAITEGSITSSYGDVDSVSITDGTTAKAWSLYGSNANNYAVAGTRFGGKNAGVLASALTNAPTGIESTYYVMYIAGTTTFGTAVSKIEVNSIGTFGTASFTVGKKMFLQVSANSDFSSSTVYSATMAANATHTFTTDTAWSASSYYRIVMERASTSTTNSGIIISNVKFYTDVEELTPVSSVAITEPASTELVVGDKPLLETTVLPSNASDKSLEWTSSDESVALVLQTGTVVAIGNGSARITATSVSDPDVSDYVDLTVSGQDTTITAKTITATGLDLTTAYMNGYHGTGIVYNLRGVMKKDVTTGELQFGNNATAGQGLIYNATRYGAPIDEIVITAGASGATKATALYVGNTMNPATTSITPTEGEGIWTYDVSAVGSYSYFAFGITESSGTNYYDSIVLNLVDEAEDYAVHFLDTTDDECTALAVTSGTWTTLASDFDVLSTDTKNVFLNADANESGTNIEKAIARYDYIVAKYGYDNFMDREVVSGAKSTITTQIDDSAMITAIVFFSIFGITTISIFYFLRKKREESKEIK